MPGAQGRQTTSGPPAPPRAPALSDVGNAEAFVRRHGRGFRYVHPWSTWLVWDERRWRPDDTGTPEALMKETVRWLAANANEMRDDTARKKALRFALASETAGRIRAGLAMAQSAPNVPVVPAELDVDPWLLNVRNGTIDLRTGELAEHDRGHLITRIADVDYASQATCPLWHRFLNRVLEDPELILFVQRAVGYALTGSTREQCLLILYGAGANGKSTFLQTLRAAFGEYGQQAPAETFLERRDSIPNDIARLRGTRLVVAAETGDGRRLNEALVKRMTGGDTITARFMRSEWFEFEPTFTPFLATNHRPEIRGTDEAIWRRIRLVPFTTTIPADERDQDLAEKLRAELPGILAWAVQGCLTWQRDGLGTAQAVTAATQDYRNDMDTIGAFLEEHCLIAPAATVSSGALFECYRLWAEAAGEHALTQKSLSGHLKERGFTAHKGAKGRRQWHGLTLAGVNE